MNPGDAPAAEDPSAELADLRARLAEAEATLSAIRRGQVDALVIDGPQGEQVFTLKGSALLMDHILDQAAEAVLVVDAEGVVLRANQAAARLGGKAPELQSFAALFPVRLAREGRPFRLEGITADTPLSAAAAAMPRPGGPDAELLVSAKAADLEDGSFRGWVVNLVDVSARKRAEEELRRSEERLRQSQRLESIGRLAGGIAHEFNNVLMAVNGYTELALGILAPGHPALPYLEEVRRGGERIAVLTRQLLSYSRKQVLSPGLHDLNRLIEEMGSMLRRVLVEDIALRLRPGPGLGLARVDASQMEQVILNLVLNARDALPRGGAITLSTRNAEWPGDAGAAGLVGGDAPAPGPYVELSVSDDGIGMEESTLAQIFEPFFTTKEFGRGSGLGLPTVYGIVRQSEGHILVESRPGRGSTFRVLLPRVAGADAGQGAPEAAVPAAPGRETVLLAEDEDAVRNFIAYALGQLGYRVLQARDGAEALKVDEESAGPIDLLLTDMVMPAMGGRELAERLRQRRPGLRVLFMSGYTDEYVLRQGLPGDQPEFIGKPFTPLALARRLRRILGAGYVTP